MPLGGLLRSLPPVAPSQVLLPSDGFEMRGVYARAVEAGVVDLHAVGDGAVGVLVHRCVSGSVLDAPELAVPSALMQCAGPRPASLGAARLVDTRPEAFVPGRPSLMQRISVEAHRSVVVRAVAVAMDRLGATVDHADRPARVRPIGARSRAETTVAGRPEVFDRLTALLASRRVHGSILGGFALCG